MGLNSTIINIPVTGLYSKNDIITLFDKIKDFNSKAISHEMSYFNSLLGDKFTDDLKDDVQNNLKVTIGVYGDNFQKTDEDIKSTNILNVLNKRPKKIIIENTSLFQGAAKRLPLSAIRLELDFERVDILDAADPLLYIEKTKSKVEIISENKDFSENYSNELRQVLNGASWPVKQLHSRYTYLLLLFTVLYPAYIWQAHNFEMSSAQDVFKDYSAGFTVFIYAFVFIVLANMFRFVYNLAKWVMPISEYLQESSKRQVILIFLKGCFVLLIQGLYVTLAGKGLLALFSWILG